MYRILKNRKQLTVPGDKVSPFIQFLYFSATAAAVILFIIYWFGFPLGGKRLLGTEYSYLLFAFLSPLVYIGIGRKGFGYVSIPHWSDYVLAVLFLISFLLCFISSDAISYGLWTSHPGALQLITASVLVFLSLEAGRRAAGWGYVTVILLSVFYSLWADRFSGPFYGVPVSLSRLITDFAFGVDGILGIPAGLVGKSILGFYVFAAAMQGLGGSDFFLELAKASLGKYRGGAAKTAVIASGLFGSLSGSITANVMTTGSLTIPAMKKAGFTPEYAAATEACASSGGDTMPPVMGGLAFIAVMVGDFEYSEMMVAAFLPTLLYYFGLLVQVDGYTAKCITEERSQNNSRGILSVLKKGWHFPVTIGFLVFGLVYMKWGYITPLYASVLILLLTAIRNKGTIKRAQWKDIFLTAGRHLSYGVAIFLATGLLMVSLYKTGMAAALSAWIITLGSENLIPVLFIGAFFNLFMGMLGLQRSSYLFLAVTMAPAVASAGNIPQVAVHLFLIFYAGLGGLTPPVAITALIAARIAGAKGLKTALISLRLGFVLLLLPFFFVFQPALILQGALWDILLFGTAVFIGVFLMASAIEAYLTGYGILKIPERVFIFFTGILLAFPDIRSILSGLVLGSVSVLVLRKRKSPNPSPPGD